MTEYNNMTLEELRARKEQLLSNTGNEKNPYEDMSIEELREKRNSIMDKKGFNESYVIQSSPLGFLERAKLSTATDEGRKQYLQENYGNNNVRKLKNNKYAVRKDDGQWYSIDPNLSSIFSPKEIAGDVADVYDEALRQVGMGIGATSGAIAGAVPGAAVGAAAGRVAGEQLVQSYGRSQGLRPEETQQQALSRQISSAGEGAFAEVIAPGFQKVTGSAMKGIKDFAVNRIYKKNLKQFMQNVYKFTAGVPEFATKQIQEKGAKFVNNRLLRDYGRFQKSVVNKAEQGIKELPKIIGKEWKKTIGNDWNKKVAFQAVDDIVQNAKLSSGLVSKDGSVRKFLSKETEKSANELLSKIDDMITRLSSRGVGKTKKGFGKIKLGDLWELRKTLDDDILFKKRSGSLSPLEENFANSFRSNIKNLLHNVSPKFEKADMKYAQVMNLLDDIKINSKTTTQQVQNLINKAFPAAGDKPVSSLPNELINGLFEADRMLPKHKQFMTDVLAYRAAEEWNRLSFRGIRAGTLGGLIGLPAGQGMAGAIIGGSVSTPKVLGRMIEAQQAIGKMTSKGLGSTADLIEKGVNPYTISALQRYLQGIGQERGEKSTIRRK